jgi:hypothetical protein
MAEYRHHGHTLEAQAAKPRGKPECRAAVNLQPVIREYVRTKSLSEKVTLWLRAASP